MHAHYAECVCFPIQSTYGPLQSSPRSQSPSSPPPLIANGPVRLAGMMIRRDRHPAVLKDALAVSLLDMPQDVHAVAEDGGPAARVATAVVPGLGEHAHVEVHPGLPGRRVLLAAVLPVRSDR